jgi:hypothetical protein
MPLVHGKGRHKRTLGTRTWPETNFLVISYLDDASAEKARAVVSGIRRRFPDEGICTVLSDAELL